MTGWTTLGKLRPGTVFEFDDGDTRPGVVIDQMSNWTDWKQLGCDIRELSHGDKRLRVRPLCLARVGSSDMERAFVAALVDDPQDGATLNAFADWLRDQSREKDAATLQVGWRHGVMDAAYDMVEAASNLNGEHERSLGDYPRPALFERARVGYERARAEFRRRLGVSDDRG